MAQYAPQRLLTHVRANQELKLSDDNRTYVDVYTGWKYPANIIEFVRSVTVFGTSIQAKYGRSYTNSEGSQAFFLKDLPAHIRINSTESDNLEVYPATSYLGYKIGLKLSDLLSSSLKDGASPYYGNVDINIISYR